MERTKWLAKATKKAASAAGGWAMDLAKIEALLRAGKVIVLTAAADRDEAPEAGVWNAALVADRHSDAGAAISEVFRRSQDPETDAEFLDGAELHQGGTLAEALACAANEASPVVRDKAQGVEDPAKAERDAADLGALRLAAEALGAAEAWEASIILDSRCWRGSTAHLQQEHHDAMIAVQHARKEAKAAVAAALKARDAE